MTITYNRKITPLTFTANLKDAKPITGYIRKVRDGFGLCFDGLFWMHGTVGTCGVGIQVFPTLRMAMQAIPIHLDKAVLARKKLPRARPPLQRAELMITALKNNEVKYGELGEVFPDYELIDNMPNACISVHLPEKRRGALVEYVGQDAHIKGRMYGTCTIINVLNWQIQIKRKGSESYVWVPTEAIKCLNS